MDLTTRYMGLHLAHPLVASASPLSYTIDGIRRLEDAGAAAVVMHSLFEEQIEGESHILDHYMSYGTESFAESLDYFPEMQHYNVGPSRYLELIEGAKAATDIPIIASLNGVSTGGWTEYAKLMEEAGADGLELNIYYIPVDTHIDGATVEQTYLQIVRDVRATIKIPIAVKVGPYFSAFANMAARLTDAGADALVLFNRFYQPDLDLEELEVVPNLVLSSSHEMRLPLRWVAILYGNVSADLAITSGVHSHIDVLKGLMAGADVTMLASELLRHGPNRLRDMRQDLASWLEDHEYESVEQLKGSMSQRNVANADAYVRANYIKMLQSWRPDPVSMMVY
ncbi:MAG: dihydroorotate dehydrogenase-like protein [Caldilineaceae bacterium]|nr:dihydroorotate dehydrogenase-like protein [Caldilineaceae bacterium]MCB0188524.1 dihydroorotate dehydrogenase-like protein [Caldilineaceae bacterium]